MNKDLSILKNEPIFYSGEVKRYLKEETKDVLKKIKLRFHRRGKTYRFGPYKMELTSHRILLTPEDKNAGSRK
jgi:hypothetical protein